MGRVSERVTETVAERPTGLSVQLLGSPRIELDGAEVHAPPGRKSWALLAYLLRTEVPSSRERLAALLFPMNFGDRNQEIHFMKNLAIAGGFLALAAGGPGAWSIDGRRTA